MKVIPKPNTYQEFSGKFVVSKDTKVYFDDIFKEQAQLFIGLVKNCLDVKLSKSNIDEAQIVFTENNNLAEEEYTIKCSQELLSISASTNKGAFYGVMSLRQMFNIDLLSNVETISCSCVNIIDKPRFAHRGISFDVARHFFDKTEIIRVLDLMSMHKLNVFHFHLTDDQGFRLQIDKYPEINEIASFRNQSLIKDNGESMDGIRHGGFYSKKDIADILLYARHRNITVIPEIDLPGHMVALISAMPQLSCKGEQIDVRERYGISKDILCAGNPQVYTVLQDIIDEVMSQFDSQIIHLGGDEAPRDNWINCPKCQQAMTENGLKNVADLQVAMFNRLSRYVEQKGWKVVGWNECLRDNLNPNVINQHWTPSITLSPKETIKHINNGRKTIISNFMHLYFDYPYAMTPLKKTYNFNPILKGVRKENASNIIGVEGAVWTEWIADRAKLDFNLFPRMAALAEVAWCNKRNYRSFTKRLANMCLIYQSLNVQYAMLKERPLNIFSRIRQTKVFFYKDSHAELKSQLAKLNKK